MKRLVYLILVIVFFSCSEKKDYKSFTITDFSKKRIDTLIPYKYKSYYVYFIKVKGFTNDTIKIKHKNSFDIKLSGKIDTIIRNDYYGTSIKTPVFDPHKATEGELQIIYSL